MKYTTGELAEMFGLTNEGVRYMEKAGIIHAERDPKNGYRRFEYDNYVRLRRAKGFHVLGFSLEEARKMLDGELSLPDTKELYQEKLKELELRKREMQLAEEDLRLQSRAIELAEAGEAGYSFTVPEPLVFLPKKKNGEVIRYPAGLTASNNLWLKESPRVKMFAAYYGNGEEEKGSVLTLQDFKELGLPDEKNLRHLDLGECACGVIPAPRILRPDTAVIFRWIRRQGKEPTGDVYCIMRLSVRGEGGEFICLHEFYAPLAN